MPVAPDLGDALLGEVLRTVPMAAAAFDLEMRYVAYNDGWLRVHGRSVETQLLGGSHYAIFPELRHEWEEVAARVLGGASVVRRGVEIFDATEGRREYLRWQMNPWRGPDGAVRGMLVYAESITEQLKIEQRLAERESLIRELFDASPVGLNLCRMDGLWLESNPAFLRIIGYTQAEADGGLTYWQLTPRRYDADEAAQLEQLRTTGHYGPYEKEFIRKDGTLVPVRLHGFLVAREGVEYIWSLIEDLTAQHELEARLEEERLKAIQASKLATLGEMAASLAHEINNPLEIIDAYAYSLRDAYARRDDAFVQEALDTLRAAVTRAGKIVHGLRKFARERAPDSAEAVPIADVISEAVDLCQTRVRTHGLSLEVDVATTAAIVGHPIELSQVFVNLLNNAFDAALASPAKAIRVEARELAGRVEVSVEDSGQGVPVELRENIFRPFFTTKGVGRGTGLGLSISRSIVERHGGTLALDPSTQMTRFVVSLPVEGPGAADRLHR